MFGKNEIVGQKFFRDTPKDQLFVTSIFFTLQGEGPYRGYPAVFVRLAKCNLKCTFCFAGNTYISMYNGTRKRIKDIVEGDHVVSWDEKKSLFVEGKVTKTFKRQTDKILKIRTHPTSTNPNDILFVTEEHPFLVKNKGWIKAGDLREGDVLLHLSVSDFINNGETVVSVECIEKSNNKSWVALSKGKDNDLDVYNFEVENTHTYVAGGKIVHNCDTFFDGGDYLTFSEIDQKITKVIEEYFTNKSLEVPQWAKDRRMVLVMTGGEPMLQSNIGSFLEQVGSSFEYTQIESNGTFLQDIPKSTTLVVSPKCLEKNGKAVKYLTIRQEVLDRADCLKFVMEANQESPYSSIPDYVQEWSRSNNKPVFISPMNVYNREPQKSKQLRADSSDISIEERSSVDEVISAWEEGLLDTKANQINHEYTGHYCITHGYILNLQLHLYCSLA